MDPRPSTENEMIDKRMQHYQRVFNQIMNSIKDKQVLQSCVDQASKQIDFFGYKLSADETALIYQNPG